MGWRSDRNHEANVVRRICARFVDFRPSEHKLQGGKKNHWATKRRIINSVAEELATLLEAVFLKIPSGSKVTMANEQALRINTITAHQKRYCERLKRFGEVILNRQQCDRTPIALD